MIKENKKRAERNCVYIVRDNEGTIYGASLIKFKAVKIKENAQYNLDMSGSFKIASIIKETLI